jgi:hypothetical protein
MQEIGNTKKFIVYNKAVPLIVELVTDSRSDGRMESWAMIASIKHEDPIISAILCCCARVIET